MKLNKEQGKIEKVVSEFLLNNKLLHKYSVDILI